LVGLYNDTGRSDDAVKLLNTIQAKNLKDATPSLVLADFLLLRKQEADAQRVLLDAKRENPEDLRLAAKLAAVIMRSDPKRAREEVDLILKKNPKDPIAMALLGETQFWAGDLESAKATLSEPLLANSPEAQYFLGAIAVKQGQLDTAEQQYRKALTLNPNYLLARSALAGLLIDKNRITDARAEVTRVLDVDKNYTPARLVKLAIDIREQRFEGVEQELLAIAKDQPVNPEVQRQLGVFYFVRGRTADAEKAYLRALELQPEAPERLQALIQFYSQTKQGEKAVQRLTAIPEDKKRASHYEMLGSVYTQMGKFAESEAAYTKALEKDPKSNADAAIAAQYIQTGRTEEGLRKLDELIKKNPSNAGAYTIKGIIYENQGKASDAKESYTRALQLDGNSDVAANNLAYMLAEEGRDLPTALTWAQSARKRQPDFAGIADTLGWVYYKLGNHILARDQLQFALSKEPNNPIFQYHLGMIYLGNKQPREAAEALRKAANSTGQFKEKALAQAALKEATK
jgi:Flp pilus assembly protein TadD